MKDYLFSLFAEVALWLIITVFLLIEVPKILKP